MDLIAVSIFLGLVAVGLTAAALRGMHAGSKFTADDDFEEEDECI